MKTEYTIAIFAIFSALSFLMMIESSKQFGPGDYLALVFGIIGTVLALCATIGIVQALYTRWFPKRTIEEDLKLGLR